ncbi:MAG TPA: rhodanese-like domain-containing protein [Acidimicrobiales bacterium]|nr:rhodanese-like domain-containing protein [Acidimicrobiales bacterium]
MTDMGVTDGPSPVPRAAEVEVSRVDAIVERARSTYRRVGPFEAAQIWASGGLLIDTRPAAQRAEFGEIPGAIVIERNVLEWRLDPTSPHHHDKITRPDQDIVVLCQAGYASSLAAWSLRQLGLSKATDLEGGYEAWLEAGLPTTLNPSGRLPGGEGGPSAVAL